MTGTSAKLRPAWPRTVNFSGGTSIWRCSDGRRRKNIYEANDKVVSIAKVKALKKRIRQLERVLGNKTLEVEILKETVRIGRGKRSISRTHWLCPDPIPMAVDAHGMLVRLLLHKAQQLIVRKQSP